MNSPVKARKLPVLKGVIEDGSLQMSVWLATLLMHGEIIQVLGGLGYEQLKPHVAPLIEGVVNEANGIDTTPGDNEQPSAGWARTFNTHPYAVNFAIDALAAITGRTCSLNIEELSVMNDELNHFAHRHGATSLPFSRRVSRFDEELARLRRDELFTGQTGAAVFWQLAVESEDFTQFTKRLEQLFSKVSCTNTTLMAITDICSNIKEAAPNPDIFEPYESEAFELTKRLNS